MSENNNIKVIFSGGGTGGHIFPAIAIADALCLIRPNAEILFVGAKGRMEMERVPKAGYAIEGLWISGLQRRLTLQNLLFPIKLIVSMWKAGQIISRFKPDVVVGTGGYASGPLLRVAAKRNVPTLIQEQNAYAGLTNKWLSKVVNKISVAYPGMERYFPAHKIVEHGNPVREEQLTMAQDVAAARKHFGLNSDKKTIMITGGSLGARTLNNALKNASDQIEKSTNVQLLWQCGKGYEEGFKNSKTAQLSNVTLLPFLDRMDLAYQAADVVICRAGALTIAELCLLGKPAILVPSPNVAEDHQTKNAMALANENAAIVIKDQEAEKNLVGQALELLENNEQRQQLGQNAKAMAHPGAAKKIAEEILKLLKKVN